MLKKKYKDEKLDQVFKNNEKWIQGKLSVNPNFSNEMGKGQKSGNTCILDVR